MNYSKNLKAVSAAWLTSAIVLMGSLAQAYSLRDFLRDTQKVNDTLMNGVTYTCENYLDGLGLDNSGSEPLVFVGFGVSAFCYFPKLQPQAAAWGQALADQVNARRSRPPQRQDIDQMFFRFADLCSRLRGGPAEMTMASFNAIRSPRFKLVAVVGVGSETHVLVCN